MIIFCMIASVGLGWQLLASETLLQAQGGESPAGLVFTIQHPVPNPSSIQWVNNENFLIRYDKDIYVWNTHSGLEVAHFSAANLLPTPEYPTIFNVRAIPNSTLIAIRMAQQENYDFYNRLILVDWLHGDQLFSVNDAYTFDINSTGQYLAYSGENGAVIYDISENKSVWESNRDAHTLFSQDGSRLIVYDNSWFEIWNTDDFSAPVVEKRLSDREIWSIKWNEDGSFLVAKELFAFVIDAETGDMILDVVHPDGWWELSFEAELSPDNSLLLTHSFDGAVRVWEVSTGNEIFAANSEWSPDAQWLSDSQHILVRMKSGDYEVRGIYDDENNFVISQGMGIAKAELSPSRRFFLVISPFMSTIRDLSTGNVVAVFEGESNGRWYASEEYFYIIDSKQVSVWNVKEMSLENRQLPSPPLTQVEYGERVGKDYGCFGCHVDDGVGPSLIGINPNERPAPFEDYLWDSILYPSNYIVDGYVDGIEPQYHLLTYPEIHALIAFIVHYSDQ